jgi:hypothetical protein
MPRSDASRKRCAIYTRKSSEEGLEQEFNSLAAQREAWEELAAVAEGLVIAANQNPALAGVFTTRKGCILARYCPGIQTSIPA